MYIQPYNGRESKNGTKRLGKRTLNRNFLLKMESIPSGHIICMISNWYLLIISVMFMCLLHSSVTRLKYMNSREGHELSFSTLSYNMCYSCTIVYMLRIEKNRSLKLTNLSYSWRNTQNLKYSQTTRKLEWKYWMHAQLFTLQCPHWLHDTDFLVAKMSRNSFSFVHRELKITTLFGIPEGFFDTIKTMEKL